MSDKATVRYARDNKVAIITISRPEAMNTFNNRLQRDLLAALQQGRDEEGVGAVVLTGEGRCFSAGADLKGSLSSNQPVDEQLQSGYRPIFECIEAMNQPVIAAVNGSASGIGMSLALACDLLVMADNAFLLSPFTAISLLPDGGLNWLLVQQLGYRRAFQLSIECERIDADRCVALGLANRITPADSLLPDAVQWAQSLAERAPLSVAATKRAMRYAAKNNWSSTFDFEAPLQRQLRESEDCAEGIAAFLEKRKPKFTGT